MSQPNRKKPVKHKLGELRIIGGTCRSRIITFPQIPGLRPTPNLVRETLFNWLSPYINNAFCLDLFAGSGALGFEALSRGAKYCLFFEADEQAVLALEQNKMKLGFTNVQIIKNVFPFDEKYVSEKFDIVFLDPPFDSDLVSQALTWLLKSDCLHKNSVVYIESEVKRDVLLDDMCWQILKDKKTGHVRYSLIRPNI